MLYNKLYLFLIGFLVHIVCNSHSLFDEKLVSNLVNCSIPVSLIENNDFAAIINFCDNDFKTLLDLSCGEKSPADQLLLLKQKYCSISLFRNFFKETLHSDLHYKILDYFFYLNDNDHYHQEYNFSSVFIEKNIDFFENFHNKIKSFNDLFSSSLDFETSSNFKFINDSIIINNQISITGNDYFDLLEKTKKYSEKHSEYVINNLSSVNLKWNKYSDFSFSALQLDSFDINSLKYKESLFDTIMLSLGLFKFDFN